MSDALTYAEVPSMRHLGRDKDHCGPFGPHFWRLPGGLFKVVESSGSITVYEADEGIDVSILGFGPYAGHLAERPGIQVRARLEHSGKVRREWPSTPRWLRDAHDAAWAEERGRNTLAADLRCALGCIARGEEMMAGVYARLVASRARALGLPREARS